MRSLLLQVPSVVVVNEFNMLINPKHPEMKRVTLSRVESFSLDRRLVGK
jgi:RES domain-containing protein